MYVKKPKMFGSILEVAKLKIFITNWSLLKLTLKKYIFRTTVNDFTVYTAALNYKELVASDKLSTSSSPNLGRPYHSTLLKKL